MDFLKEVETKLDLPSAEKEQVLRELRSHYEEVRSELMDSGMDAGSADRGAARRLGDPSDVAASLQSVHCQATCKMALRTAFPFIGQVVPLAFAFLFAMLRNVDLMHALTPTARIIASVSTALLALLTIVLVHETYREMKRGGRPMWLATWLPSSIYLLSMLPGRLISVGTTLSDDQALALWFANRVLMTLLISVIALWVTRNSPRPRHLLLGYALMVTTVSCLPFVVGADQVSRYRWWTLLYSTMPSFAMAPLVLVIALKMFARHRYGNVALACLFLFTMYSRTFIDTMLTDSWLYIGMVVLVPVYQAVFVMAYARACDWRRKIFWLAAGLVFTGVLDAVGFSMSTMKLGPAGILNICALNLLVLMIVVLVPLMLERLSWRWPVTVR